MSLQSLIATGTKVWLDSIDPELVKKNRAMGASGATSNPIIIGDLIKTGRFDNDIMSFMDQGKDDDEIAWLVTDKLVKEAQAVFLPVWEETKANNGYVSFELDPLLEDLAKPVPHNEAVSRYVELGKKWAAGHKNRMIKVPATPAGLDALEPLARAGITLNVTLIFSQRQYELARNAIWRGGEERVGGVKGLKSVYSIFVSRVDVYTEKKVPDLSPAAQGLVGIVNAKRLWRRTNHSGKIKISRSSRKSSSPAPAQKSPPTPPTNTSKHSPAATSKPTPPPPTTPSKNSTKPTPARSKSCPAKPSSMRSTERSILKRWKTPSCRKEPPSSPTPNTPS